MELVGCGSAGLRLRCDVCSASPVPRLLPDWLGLRARLRACLPSAPRTFALDFRRQCGHLFAMSRDLSGSDARSAFPDRAHHRRAGVDCRDRPQSARCGHRAGRSAWQLARCEIRAGACPGCKRGAAGLIVEAASLDSPFVDHLPTHNRRHHFSAEAPAVEWCVLRLRTRLRGVECPLLP